MTGASVRVAGADDVDAIAALTRSHRHRLAAWAPLWWAVAPGADELHPLWLGHLVGQGRFRVVVADDAAVACAAMVPTGEHQWFFDDVAVADDSLWPEVAPLLFAACPERPALTCLSVADDARRTAFESAGATWVSSYWVGVPSVGPALPVVAGGDAVPHTFVPLPFGPDGRLSGVPAPPIYDAGGTVTIAERVASEADAVAALSAAAAAAGDVRLCVIAAPDTDVPGLTRTVDVHRLP